MNFRISMNLRIKMYSHLDRWVTCSDQGQPVTLYVYSAGLRVVCCRLSENDDASDGTVFTV